MDEVCSVSKYKLPILCLRLYIKLRIFDNKMHLISLYLKFPFLYMWTKRRASNSNLNLNSKKFLSKLELE